MSKSFGFMMEKTEDIGFFNDFPEIWKDIRLSETRKVTTSEGVFFILRFNPNEQTFYTISTSIFWYLVIMVPHENYVSGNILLNRAILMGILFISPFFIFIGLIMGRSLIRNRYYMKRLEKSATHDDMTGLLNHQAVMEQLDYLIHLTTRQKNNLCSAFIDLNDLKKINDTMGHEQGDLLIKTMSESILSVVRNTDIAARIDGDEFLIILPDLSEENSRIVLERIKKDFGNKGSVFFGFETQFSWGISQWELNNDSPEKFIARADKAMYLMKNKMRSEA